MAYQKARRARGRRRPFGGLDANGFDNCPAGQINDANNNCVAYADPGTSTPGELTAGGPAGGGSSPSSPSGGASPSGPGFFASAASVVGRLFGSGATPAYPLQTGPSTTEILLIAGLGLGAVLLLTKD